MSTHCTTVAAKANVVVDNEEVLRALPELGHDLVLQRDVQHHDDAPVHFVRHLTARFLGTSQAQACDALKHPP